VVSSSFDIAAGGAVAAATSLVYPDGRPLDNILTPLCLPRCDGEAAQEAVKRMVTAF
jgi:hypothetical protein